MALLIPTSSAVILLCIWPTSKSETDHITPSSTRFSDSIDDAIESVDAEFTVAQDGLSKLLFFQKLPIVVALLSFLFKIFQCLDVRDPIIKYPSSDRRQRRVFLPEQYISEWPGSFRLLGTHWPWNIRTSLAVLWGVCWMYYDNENQRSAVPSQNFTQSEEFWDFFPRETGAETYSQFIQLPQARRRSLNQQGQCRSLQVPRQAMSRASQNSRNSSGPGPSGHQATTPGYAAPYSISNPVPAPTGDSQSLLSPLQQAEGAFPHFASADLSGSVYQPTRRHYSAAGASPSNDPDWYISNTWSGPVQNPGLGFGWESWSAATETPVTQAWLPHQTTQPQPHNRRVTGNDFLRHPLKTEPQEPYVPSVILHSPLDNSGNSYNLFDPNGQSRNPDFGPFRMQKISTMSHGLQTDPTGLPSPHSDGSERRSVAAEHSADESIQRDSRKGGPEPPRDVNGKIFCPNPECNGKTFERKCEWSKHMDKHDRPYVCQEPGCEKLRGFTYSGGLLRHQREVHKQHGGPKETFMCPYPNCKRHQGEGFTRKENLSEHMRRVHVDPEDPMLVNNVPMAPPIKSRKRKQPPANAEEGEEVAELREEVKKLRAENEEKDLRISRLEQHVQMMMAARPP